MYVYIHIYIYIYTFPKQLVCEGSVYFFYASIAGDHPYLSDVPREGGSPLYRTLNGTTLKGPRPLVHQFGCLFCIKMFAFVVGVACGAQQFLHFTSKMKFSRYVLVLRRPQGQTVEAF